MNAVQASHAACTITGKDIYYRVQRHIRQVMLYVQSGTIKLIYIDADIFGVDSTVFFIQTQNLEFFPNH